MLDIPTTERETCATSAFDAMHPSLRKGLIGYWSVSAGSITDGFVRDISGRGNHGIPYGLTDECSMYGRTLVGTNDSFNERIELSSQIVVPAAPFTIWVHHKPSGSTARLYGSKNGHAEYGMYQTTGGAQIASSGGMEGAAFATPSVWHQAAITVNAAGGVFYYIDAVVKATDSGFTGTLTFDNVMNTTTADWAIDGKFRAMGVWSYELSDAELNLLLCDPHAVERKFEDYPVYPGAGGGGGGSVPIFMYHYLRKMGA
jgi:hypothetical protein